MARRCDLTGKKVMFGNNRSHAMNATRRRFNPNIQTTGIYSDALGRQVTMRLSTRAMRTVEKNGGLDAYLASIADTKLSPAALKVKRQIQKAQARAQA